MDDISSAGIDFGRVSNVEDILNLGESSASGFEGLVEIVLAFFLVFCIIALIVYLLKAIGRYKLFKKANVEGWKAFIPIYNTYVECEITGISTYWVLISIVIGFCSSFLGPLAFLGYIAQLYFSIILSLSLARSYGKTEAFGICMFLLGPIFYPMLGFGKSDYEGPKPLNDLILGDNSIFAGKKIEIVSSVKCPKCGAVLSSNDKFCPKCGESLNKEEKTDKNQPEKDKKETE